LSRSVNQGARPREQGTALRNERACDERRPWRPPYRRLWPLAALGAVCAACAANDGLPLGPLRTAGAIQETYRTTQFADEPRRHSNQNEVLVQANSYVWQPWFMTADADVDVAYDIERGGGDAGGDADSILLSGGAGLGILPLSRYPSTLAYRRRDSRIEGRATGGDFTSDRVDVTSQAIISSDLRAFASAGYEVTDQPDVGNGEQMRANLSVLKQFTTDELTATLSYDDADFDSDEDEDEHETTAVGTLAYDSRPFENVTAQSSATAIYEADDFETSTFDRGSVQGLTTAQWHPPDLPFTVNGALRALAERTETEEVAAAAGSSETTSRILNGTIGLNYPIRPRLTANAGVNARIESIDIEAGGISDETPTEGGVTTGGSLLGSLNYQSLTAPVLGFDWSWNATGSTNLSAESDVGVTDQETVTVGHGVERSFDLAFPGRVSLRASEEVDVTSATEERFSAGLFHNLSLTHNSGADGVTTFARASISDRRDLVGGDGLEFQLIQFVLSRQETIDLTSNWLANLSLQASRQTSADQDAETTVSANGTAAYRETDIFGVRDLRFISELTLSALGLESVLEETEEEDDTRLADRFQSEWANRLEYRIGRIFASLEGSALYSQGEIGNSIFLRVRREFGGGEP